MIGEGLGNHLEEQQQQAKKEEEKKKEAAEKQSNQDDKYLKIYQENQKRNQQRTILY